MTTLTKTPKENLAAVIGRIDDLVDQVNVRATEFQIGLLFFRIEAEKAALASAVDGLRNEGGGISEATVTKALRIVNIDFASASRGSVASWFEVGYRREDLKAILSKLTTLFNVEAS